MPNGRDPVDRTSAANGGLDFDLATSRVTLPLSAAATAGMPAGAVPFFLRVTDSDGVVATHLDTSKYRSDGGIWKGRVGV
ncbi:hypothetical protein [Methylorubrum extorquens]|uniref:hypothetical protein n=1 Tax=Methylorubrum extorquens TaxID=408 RepID=UPI0002E48C48|nr:hypothetical protein [Methylorubrum extorquens]MCP1545278.1 hypothetical protein [Methylorubrum extorquens]MCP1587375.1 hypothetical protein [Methylorubrum extorquens]